MIQRTLRFVAAMALLAAPFVLRAQDPTACQAGEFEVRSLSFKGNHQFEDAVLANGIRTEASGFFRRVFHVPIGKRKCFDQAAFDIDHQLLIYHYRWSGFPDVSIDTAVVREPSGVEITFTIHEGPPSVVDSLAVVGLDSVADRESITEHLPLRAGQPFNRYLLETTRDTIVRRLQDDGYPAARVLREFHYDSASRHAQVVYVAAPGTLAVLGEITISVTPKDAGEAPEISANTARKFLGVSTGDRYRESSLERAKKNLYLTQAYSSVSVNVDSSDVEPPGDSVVRVHVALTEDAMHSARLSGGYGSLDCFRTEGEFTHLNFLSTARRFDARARLSKIGIGQPLSGAEALCSYIRDDPYSVDLNYYGSVALTEPTPSLFGTQPSATLFSERRSEYKAFLRTVPFGAVLATTRQGTSRSFGLSYTAEYGRTEAQPAIFCALQNLCLPEDREPLLSNRFTATLGTTFAQHWYDDPQYPSKRATLQVELRHASRFIGSDRSTQFNRATADLSTEISLGNEFTLAMRARAGAVVGPSLTGTSSFIPPQERLYAGGGQTVRGFDQNDLGPKVYIAGGYDTVRADGATGEISSDEQVIFRTRSGTSADRSVPIGGSAVVIGNVELRIPSPWLHDRLQFAAFLDAGELWSPGASRREDRFGDLKYTPGLGVRVFTVIGVVRLDIAYNKYAQRAGSSYFDTPVSQGGQLFCVSPGNTLAVTGLGPGRVPVQQSGPCPADFQPAAARGFLRKLNLTIGFGQAY
jgi:outer membrane protein insertion porin family/translocation and assembly module TamA